MATLINLPHHGQGCTLHPHHPRDIRATSPTNTLHLNHPHHLSHITRPVMMMMMMDLASLSCKDALLLSAAAVCWRNAATKDRVAAKVSATRLGHQICSCSSSSSTLLFFLCVHSLQSPWNTSMAYINQKPGAVIDIYI
ncbi:hypothetical protein BHE74_00001587 [Ensete ventricosum]|nr:hypothetical protein GW17_00026124 [Ensete ventricosum]RWW89469.1 hypothetical protein BHE74_00001587 [Ensete ventricosum]RZS13140.1 hypothetical protein BHM03_00044670 [Ensete ventricosum]